MTRAEGKNAAHELYLDLIKPLASQLGDASGQLLSLALNPAEAAERLRSFISTLKPKLNQVPEPQLAKPRPEIARGIFSSVGSHEHGTPLVEMFAELLATEMDSARRLDAHPSFVSVLNDLVADEARILGKLRPGISYRTKIRLLGSKRGSTTSAEVPLLRKGIRLDNQDRVDALLLNLERLGLTSVHAESDAVLLSSKGTSAEILNAIRGVPVAGDMDHQELLEEHRQLVDSFVDMDEFALEFTQRIQLTEFGRMFHDACVPK